VPILFPLELLIYQRPDERLFVAAANQQAALSRHFKATS
jgi:hypothetical protein